MGGRRGLIFSIEEFAVYDGPGIRTAVFFKGCPLRCNWCHNPEGLEGIQQILRSPNGCVKCGACYKEAEKNGGVLTKSCVDLCPRGLIRESGKYFEAEELAGIFLKNKDVFDRTGGGVTFSGGECLAQVDFLLEVTSTLKGKINIAIETSGYGDTRKFRELLKNIDLVYYDLKIIDRENFKKYTGGDISVVLKNFGALCESGAPFTVRVPLIPGVTDTAENLGAIADIVKDSGAEVEFMPYNKMAGGKYKLVGREYRPSFDTTREINYDLGAFIKNGVAYKIK
ncbi:MAG: glycyl-radical enzyme activating protein [Clostridia bacterium]|nr:glycyl-radical enzyme activating protein [Clostridia bacterium]